jgi:uncharacterized integral membrane protein
MKRSLYLVLGLAVMVLGLSFAYKNPQIVTLKYHFGLGWEGPLSLVLLTSFALGVGLGILASLVLVLRMHHDLRRARREIRDIEQEVRSLRALPIRDVL